MCNAAGNIDLPEPWLFPECDLKDPAVFGPLHGRRKSAVDWFTIVDVMEASRNRCGDYEQMHGQGQFLPGSLMPCEN